MANRRRPNADQQLLNRKNIEEDNMNAFLMSPLLDGFSLNEKRWSEYARPCLKMWQRLISHTVNFLVEWVQPLQLNPDAFDHLVLPAEHKALVLAFAKQQDEKVQ